MTAYCQALIIKGIPGFQPGRTNQMAEDDQSEPVDTVGPWTLKAVPTQTRQAVVRAAQRENLTVGQWLERRVREWTEAGSPVAVIAQARESSTPQSDSLAITERAIAAAVALAGAKGVPRDFRREANARLRDSLPAARVGDLEQPKLLAAPVANGALMDNLSQ
jgi:hypothetical protein